MFMHPSLRRITLSCTNFEADICHSSIPSGMKKTTPLQSLTLIECNVNVKFLDVVLSLPKALKELNLGERLHVFPDCIPSKDPAVRTSHPLFMDALAWQADSLERLSHISGSIAHMVNYDPKYVGSKGLQKLTQLKYLELGMESTLWKYLENGQVPESLQTLKTTDAAWANSTSTNELFFRHPSKVLRRCAEVIRRMPQPVNLDVRFNDSDCEHLLTTIPTRGNATLLTAMLGGRIRSPLYKLATELQTRGARLRVFVHKFSTHRRFIPPFMYGEEIPKEVQIYTSDDFWRVGGRNFRVIDDEDFHAEVLKRARMVCQECEKRNRECFNAGDGSGCLNCENGNGVCVYDE